jgi:flagellar protein FliO/FliZ
MSAGINPSANVPTVANDAAFSAVSVWPTALLTLLGIVLLIVVLGWLARRVSGGHLASSRQMKVVATLPMGARERLVLVEVAGQQLLLGVTAQSISHLHTFDTPVILSGLGESEFSSRLKQFMARPESAAPSQPARASHAEPTPSEPRG